jgi:hypothetical protein
MLVLNRLLLNRENVVINALKALASIISICDLHVIFLSNITPRYFTLFAQSQSQSHFTAHSQSLGLGVEPILWTFDQILFLFQECGSNLLPCLCGVSSLTRGRVCPL